MKIFPDGTNFNGFESFTIVHDLVFAKDKKFNLYLNGISRSKKITRSELTIVLKTMILQGNTFQTNQN